MHLTGTQGSVFLLTSNQVSFTKPAIFNPTMWTLTTEDSDIWNLAAAYVPSSGLYVAAVDYTNGLGKLMRVNSEVAGITGHFLLTFSAPLDETAPKGKNAMPVLTAHISVY